MSARARWIAISVVSFAALGSVALYATSANLARTSPERGPKTWLVQPGETLRVQADEVLTPGDRFVCVGKGGPTDRSRPRDIVDDFGGSTMVVDAEGNVTIYCVPSL